MGKTMETAQHTPGPWKVVKDDEGGLVIRQQPEDGYYICELNSHAGNDPFGENNAHLIAVAPEMLALLKEIEESPVGSAKSGLEFKIRQLVAKAEGRS